MLRQLAVVYIYKVREPGDRRPRLLGIPSPVVAPGLLRPEGTEEHADSHKGQPHVDEIVRDLHLLSSRRLLLEEQQIDRHHRRGTQHGIGKHIHDDVRRKPRTLQCRHQRLGVDLGLEEVHTDEHQRQQRRERQDPLILPARIDHQSHQRQEERIPESRLTHRPQGRTLQRDPHRQDKTEEYHEARDGCRVSQYRLMLPRRPGTHNPQQHGCDGKIHKLLPGHTRFLLPPSTNILTAPPSII